MNALEEPTGTILIVDDEPQNVQVVGTMLDSFGYDFMVARDGEEALRRVAARRPDLILLDIQMPGLDGFEVCRAIRGIEAMADVPVIFLSASDDKNSIVRALECGGADYVTKPFNKAELLARVRTHLRLKKALDDEAELLAATERFLEIMAHDLKNWIGSAHFSAQLLRSLPEMPEKGLKAAATIEESTGEAIRFIREFLAGARDSKTEIALQKRDVDLSLLCGELATQHDPAARSKGIRLRLTLPETPVVARTDRTALRRVLDNLISNAIKFSPPDGSVEIALSSSPVRLTVRDEGPGFTEEDLENLFAPYERLSARPTAGEVSTGLGLSIVKKLSERLGVRLGIECPGPGAIWTVEIPS